MNLKTIKNLKLVCFCLVLFVAFSCKTGSVEDWEHASDVIKTVASTYAPDPRVALFDVHPEKRDDGRFILKGRTNLDEAYQFLKDTLAGLHIQFIDSVKLLPSPEIGNRFWGLVTISVAPMRKEARFPAEMVSQTIMGTPVKLLDKSGEWYLVQTPDAYLGWITGSSIVAQTEAEHRAWIEGDRYVFSQRNGWVYNEPETEALPVSDLVMGNIVDVIEKKNAFLKIRLPDGREGFVKASECVSFDDWASKQPNAGDLIETAKMLLGSPYLWGGASTKGIDCSGFTKICYYSQAIILQRDASQQALYGEALSIDNFQFQPGDLLFFGSGRNHITHVGLYLGDDHFIHSSGRVKISSFNPNDPDFDSERKKTLVAARRVLNSLNTGQIIQVKDHPWYN